MKRQVFIHLDNVIIPEIAENISIQHSGAPNFHIIGIGQLAFPSHKDCRALVIQGQHFNKDWIKKYVEGGWTPREYADWLTKRRDSLEPLSLTVETEVDTLRLDWPQGLIDFAYWEVDSHFTNNIRYSLVIYEFLDHTIGELTQVITTDGNATVEVPSPERADNKPSAGNTHTVVSGEYLYAISRRITSSGNNWRELYELNKTIIHSRATAEHQGRLIFPGQVLTLPEWW